MSYLDNVGCACEGRPTCVGQSEVHRDTYTIVYGTVGDDIGSNTDVGLWHGNTRRTSQQYLHPHCKSLIPCCRFDPRIVSGQVSMNDAIRRCWGGVGAHRGGATANNEPRR